MPTPSHERGWIVIYSRTDKWTGEVEYQNGRIWRTREDAQQAAVRNGWSWEIIEVRTVWPDQVTLQQARAA